jgi:hypothetical protein
MADPVAVDQSDGMGPTDPHAVDPHAIATRLAAVETELAAAAGSSSLCALSRSGEQVDGVKHLEGRMAALMELRRTLRRGGVIKVVVAELLSSWRAALDDVRRRDQGPSWVAYRAGGVDELLSVAEELETAVPDAAPPGAGPG